MPKSITKNDIVFNISKETGITQVELNKIINLFLHQIEKHYRDGNSVELRKFGTFYSYFRKSRSYKHPITKTEKTMEDKHILKFKPSRQLFI